MFLVLLSYSQAKWSHSSQNLTTHFNCNFFFFKLAFLHQTLISYISRNMCKLCLNIQNFTYQSHSKVLASLWLMATIIKCNGNMCLVFYVSYVLCHLSCVMCHVSPVKWIFFLVKKSDIYFFLLFFLNGQRVGASWWRVGYQRGYPL